MNCANHPDRERAAFCQNCGKPLCTECIRTVGTSTFCEQCLAARVATPPVYPPAAYASAPGEPSPGLAALLGFIPGVGAMYNGQYAKGIVHLIVFVVLVSLASDVNGIFGLFIAGWIFYQVIEAHHTARARRDGTPLPNPFGLNDLSERLGFGKAWPATGPVASGQVASDPTAAANPYAPPTAAYGYAPPVSNWGAATNFGTAGNPGAPDAYATTPVPPVTPVGPFEDPALAYTRHVPSGAVWLIGLGIFFLLANSGIFSFHARLFGPFLLIGLGVWIFVRRMTSTGHGFENDGTADYRWRLTGALNSSFWLILTGFIWMLDAFRILSWSRSWPLYLIGVGVFLFIKRTPLGNPPMPYSAYGMPPATPPAPGTGIVAAPHSDTTTTTGQEGR